VEQSTRGKSPALILDDADLEHAASTIATAEAFLTGQSCASLTRVIVSPPATTSSSTHWLRLSKRRGSGVPSTPPLS
jgi:hypothetical protein